MQDHESIGEMFANDVAKLYRGMEPRTVRCLNRVNKQLALGLEAACPMAVGPKHGGGVTMAYGPMFDSGPDGTVMLMATTNKVLYAVVDGHFLPWLQATKGDRALMEQYSKLPIAEGWRRMTAAIDAGDGVKAANMVCLKMASGDPVAVQAQLQSTRDKGFMPVIVTLAYCNLRRKLACGIIAIHSLPPSLATQVERAEATVQ